MNMKQMKKSIREQIENGERDKNKVFKAVFDASTSATKLLAAIHKEFKKAGLTKSISNSSLKETRERIMKDTPTFSTYAEMLDYAEELQNEFHIHEDDEKGIKSALTAIRKYLKDEGENIPKKSSFKPEAAFTINYMIEAEDEATLDGLQQYVSEEMRYDMDDEESQKALRIRLGTKFNPYFHCVNRIPVEY